jgi:hypothetical protein
MAKFLPGIAFAQIRGSIGGTVFSANSNGVYTRNRSKPVNPNTQAQQDARNLLSGVASSWKLLTDAQRQTWKDQVANYPYIDSLGQIKQYTAMQLYMAVNQRLTNAGLAMISTIGAPVSIPELQALTATGDVSDSKLEVTVTINGSTTTPANTRVNVYATAPLSAGKSFLARPDFRRIATINASTPTPINLYTNYVNVFGAGAFTAGNRIAVRVEILMTQTGQLSPSLDTFTVIQA